MTGAALGEGTHVLIITGPMRDRLYERFSRLYASSASVSVLKDRRYGERRRSSVHWSTERRLSDRRVVRAEWIFPPATV